MKVCSSCSLLKDYSEYHRSRNSADGYRFQCKVCVNKKRRETCAKKKNENYVPTYVKINLSIPDELVGKDRNIAYNKEYRKLYKKEISVKKRTELDQAKIDGINHYGGKCTCCGEATYEFLTLEHLEGRPKNNKKRRTGKGAWLQVKQEGFPDKYTVLCFNCNCAKGIHGSCPHTWKK